MSPRTFAKPAPETVLTAERRLWIGLGIRLRDARLAKRWGVAELARRASVSTDVVYLIEGGGRASTEAVLRVVGALGLRHDLELTDPRRKAGSRPALSADPVHSAMGEFEVAHLRPFAYGVGLDEPYQHYQFAGRADVVAWNLEHRALLHIENRTRFPDFQEMAGSFNAKRAYLGESLGGRLGISRWGSETHVMAALWSSEVLHALRLRPDSFRAVCPDSIDTFRQWWCGEPPRTGVTSTMIVLDPLATGRQRVFIGLDEALTARPRHRGYLDVASLLRARAVMSASARNIRR